MRLLILLSAMIAGLTGLIAGDPASARAGEPSAIAACATMVTEQVRTARAVRRTNVERDWSVAATPFFSERSFVSQTHKVNERRNE